MDWGPCVGGLSQMTSPPSPSGWEGWRRLVDELGVSGWYPLTLGPDPGGGTETRRDLPREFWSGGPVSDDIAPKPRISRRLGARRGRRRIQVVGGWRVGMVGGSPWREIGGLLRWCRQPPRMA